MPTFREMLVRVRDRSDDVSEPDIFFVLMVLGEWDVRLEHWMPGEQTDVVVLRNRSFQR
jgi:hypothetical protein